tara:strand:+ start:3250 stop:3438 length:189 start_codon:yes stop_codon:yes gene_type:complete
MIKDKNSGINFPTKGEGTITFKQEEGDFKLPNKAARKKILENLKPILGPNLSGTHTKNRKDK